MNIPAQNIKRIAVLRALYLGDLLCAIPALRAMRSYFREAEISLIGLPWAESFVERFHHYIDRFIQFPGFPGLPEQIPHPLAVETFLETMKKEKFDLVFQMQGDGSIVNDLLRMFRADLLIGYSPDVPVTGQQINLAPYPHHISEIHRNLGLLTRCGIPEKGDRLEFPTTQKDLYEFNSLKLPEKYICLHPGSRSYLRQWPPKYFAAIGDYCFSKGYPVVVTGTEEEIPLSKEVQKYMRSGVIDLAGVTRVGTVALVIKYSSALVSNCTGVSHIADAVRTPSVIVSMDGEPARWSPADKNLHFVYDWKKEPLFNNAFLSMTGFLNHIFKAGRYAIPRKNFLSC